MTSYAKALARERDRERKHRKTRQGGFDAAMSRPGVLENFQTSQLPNLQTSQLLNSSTSQLCFPDPASSLDLAADLADARARYDALAARLSRERNAPMLLLVLDLVLANGRSGRELSKYELWRQLPKLCKPRKRRDGKSAAPSAPAGGKRPRPSTTAH